MRCKYLCRGLFQRTRVKADSSHNWELFLTGKTTMKGLLTLSLVIATVVLPRATIAQRSIIYTTGVPKQLSYNVTAQEQMVAINRIYSDEHQLDPNCRKIWHCWTRIQRPSTFQFARSLIRPTLKFKCAEVHNAAPGRTLSGHDDRASASGRQAIALRIVALKPPDTGGRIMVRESLSRRRQFGLTRQHVMT